MPRQPRLTKRDERIATALLSRLPLSAPRIDIAPFTANAFEVGFQESGDCLTPLRVGHCGIYADYDARSAAILEADYQEVSRYVRARGIWSYEVRRIGGPYPDGRFTVNWYEVFYCHVGRHVMRELHQCVRWNEWKEPPSPRHLADRGDILWDNTGEAQGPTHPQLIPAGFSVVTIEGQAFDCMRTLTLMDVESDEEGEKPEWVWLDVTYITREGHTVLRRRYHTEWHRNQMARFLDADWPTGRARLSYNGVDFYAWFDMLTDITLSQLLKES